MMGPMGHAMGMGSSIMPLAVTHDMQPVLFLTGRPELCSAACLAQRVSLATLPPWLTYLSKPTGSSESQTCARASARQAHVRSNHGPCSCSSKAEETSQGSKGAASEMQDPVDKFHAPRDKLLLNPSDDERDMDDLDDEPIYDLQNIADNSDEDDSEESDDQQEPTEEESGRIGKCKLRNGPVLDTLKHPMPCIATALSPC